MLVLQLVGGRRRGRGKPLVGWWGDCDCVVSTGRVWVNLHGSGRRGLSLSTSKTRISELAHINDDVDSDVLPGLGEVESINHTKHENATSRVCLACIAGLSPGIAIADEIKTDQAGPALCPPGGASMVVEGVFYALRTWIL